MAKRKDIKKILIIGSGADCHPPPRLSSRVWPSAKRGDSARDLLLNG
jgi:hypothetical protein